MHGLCAPYINARSSLNIFKTKKLKWGGAHLNAFSVCAHDLHFLCMVLQKKNKYICLVYFIDFVKPLIFFSLKY